MRRTLPGILAVLLFALPAYADKPEKAEKAADKHDEKAGKKDDKPEAAKGKDDDDDDALPDGGTAGRLTPAQLSYRKSVWERREKALEAKVHGNGKAMTEEQRGVVRAHYLKLARLMRIRDLAQEEKNDAVVKRVDAAIEKEEKLVDTRLEKAAAKSGGAK